MQESLMGITCVYCGKKYKDRQMNGSVCPRCGHIIKLYDENDDRWNCEYCGLILIPNRSIDKDDR